MSPANIFDLFFLLSRFKHILSRKDGIVKHPVEQRKKNGQMKCVVYFKSKWIHFHMQQKFYTNIKFGILISRKSHTHHRLFNARGWQYVKHSRFRWSVHFHHWLTKNVPLKHIQQQTHHIYLHRIETSSAFKPHMQQHSTKYLWVFLLNFSFTHSHSKILRIHGDM